MRARSAFDEGVAVRTALEQTPGKTLVAVVNFTPVPRDGYRIGVPVAGPYLEVINSDSNVYGGSNLGNQRMVATEPLP